MKKPQRKLPTARKSAPRKRTRAKTDAIRAFQLVCALIVVSICVSFAIITARNNSLKQEGSSPLIESAGTESSKKKTEKKVESVPAPKIVIQEESPVKPAVKPQAKPEPAPKPETKPEPVVITSIPAATKTTTTKTNTSATTTTAKTATTTSSAHKGNIAFVIDDAGNNLRELEPFLKIDGPLTIAVLPGLPHSAEAAKRIRAAGKDVILHQPMEAIGGQNPGPGAIYSNMSAEQVRAILTKNLEEVGPVVGINNHQGSKITMDKTIMETVLSFCAENKIYFLDSRTTADTAAPSVARRLGMKIAERDTFLDNEQDKEAMMRYLSNGLTRAQRNGTSIMIGHTWSPALATLLAEQYPVLTIQGYTIKTISDLLK